MPHLKELFSESSPLPSGGHADILLDTSSDVEPDGEPDAEAEDATEPG